MDSKRNTVVKSEGESVVASLESPRRHSFHCTKYSVERQNLARPFDHNTSINPDIIASSLNLLCNLIHPLIVYHCLPFGLVELISYR